MELTKPAKTGKPTMVLVPMPLLNNIYNIMQDNNYPSLNNGLQNIISAGVQLYEESPDTFRKYIVRSNHKN